MLSEQSDDNSLERAVVDILCLCRHEHLTDNDPLLRKLLKVLGVSPSERELSQCVLKLRLEGVCRIGHYGADNVAGLVLSSHLVFDAIDQGHILRSHDQ